MSATTATITQYFTELVQIDSPSGSEQQVAQYLLAWLERNGFSHKQDEIGNLYASRNCNQSSVEPLLLCAHMDTVQPGVGIVPVVQEGYFQSAGDTILGADDKASVAAIMVAVEKMLTTKSGQEKALELLFTVKEETGGGVEHFPFEWITSKRAIVCDLARPIGALGIGSPFIINFRINIRGKAAHASQPDIGKNAFIGLQKILQAIEVGNLDDGMTTINIGTLKGGTTINTIPELCELAGEVRSFREDLYSTHLASIQKVALQVEKDTGLLIDFSTDGYCPGYLYELDSPWVLEVGKVLHDSIKRPVSYEKSFGVSDANILAAEGITTVVLSDGVMNAHTVHEKVALADMVMLCKVVENVLQATH